MKAAKIHGSNRRMVWIGFAAMASVYFLSYFHRVSPSALAPYLMESFGVSGALLGFMASTYFYSYGFMQPVVGVLVDRWKPRRVVTVSTMLMSVGCLFFALAPGIGSAFIGRVLIGIGAGGVFVPCTWYVSKWFRLKERGFVFSLWLIAGNTGAIVAAGPLGALSSSIGWRGAMLFLTGITVACGILAWFFIHDEPTGVSGSAPHNTAKVGARNSSAHIPWTTILKELVQNKPVLFGMTATLLSYGALMSFQGLWSIPFLIDVYGCSKTSASNIMTLLPVGYVVGSFILGKVFDTKFGTLAFRAGYCLTLAVYLLFALFPNGLSLSMVGVTVFVLGFAYSVFSFIMRTYTEAIPPSHFGSTMGIVNAMPLFGGVLLQPLTGYIFDAVGHGGPTHPLIAYRYFFIFLVLVLAVATFLAFGVRRRA